MDRASMRGMNRASLKGQASSSQPATVMDPAVWGRLLEDLMLLVFARLEVPQINRLRCLSKAWLGHIESTNSKFRQLCAEAHPKLFALITERELSADQEDFGKHPIHVYDIKSNVWHSHEIDIQPPDLCKRFNIMGAHDGGLVCFVCACLRRNCRLLQVVNPLTNELKELEHNVKGELRMIQLVMDRKTKVYKLLVVGYNTRGLVAGLYDSGNDKWTKTNMPSDLIFGLSYNWGVPPAIDGPSAYDCAEGRLFELNELHLDNSPDLQTAQTVQNWALIKDHLFVLHKDKIEGRKGYIISEFQAQKRAPYLTKLKDHDCGKWGKRSKSPYWLALVGCNGFLLVYAGNSENFIDKPHYEARVYDLANCKWHVVPTLPGERTWCKHEWMCELQWDAVP